MTPDVISTIRSSLENPEIKEIIEHRDTVIARFSPMFKPDSISRIEADDFNQFLSFKNNRHWSSLERQKNRMCRDIISLRNSLSIAVDEAVPLKVRVDNALQLDGMGIGTLSAILLVAYPGKYGVWNGASKAAMSSLDLWPATPRGSTQGEIYTHVNAALIRISKLLDVDLWTLDALWWGIDVDPVQASLKRSSPKTLSNPIRIFDSRQKSIWEIRASVINTVNNSNGQTVPRIIKNKELRMTELGLERHIERLLEIQNNCCAITGIKFQFSGDGDDINLRPSLDRIDSDGHYTEHNTQLVCRFINFWKQDANDLEFRRLIGVVRRTADTSLKTE